MSSSRSSLVEDVQAALREQADPEKAARIQAYEHRAVLSGLSYREATKHIEELVR